MQSVNNGRCNRLRGAQQQVGSTTNANNVNSKSNDVKDNSVQEICNPRAKSWLSMEVKTTSKSKIKKSRPIINPVFNVCANIADEKYWQNLFTEAAYGRFPSGFMFQNNILTYQNGSRLKQISISRDDMGDFNLYIICKNFISQNSGLRSHNEKKVRYEQAVAKMKTPVYESWNKVNSRDRNNLLFSYARKIIAHMGLSDNDYDNLVLVLKLGVALGDIKASHITMQENSIVHINNISFEPRNKSWLIVERNVATPTVKPNTKHRYLTVVPSTQKDKRIKDFHKLWQKYVTNVAKDMQNTKEEYSSYSTQYQDSFSQENTNSNMQSTTMSNNYSRENMPKSNNVVAGQSPNVELNIQTHEKIHIAKKIDLATLPGVLHEIEIDN